MKVNLLVFIFILSILSGAQAQESKVEYCQDPEFKTEIDKYLANSVPFISVASLANNLDEYLILDAREPEEFDVSHIKGAKHIGYEHVKLELLKSLDKEAKIVVYCSIGFRSEKIGEYLISRGYKEVYNLYGSIFEWVNQSKPVFDKYGEPSLKVHAYDKDWQQWLSLIHI